jgi:spermidine/putrescine transport system substrate-binding protein
MLYGFEVDSGKNDIILGNINAYVAWSGDAAYAIDVASGDAEDEDGNVLEDSARRSISYYIPEEGSNIWFDGLVMPSGSNNYDAVYAFLDFICDPSSVYDNMNYIGYTSVIGGDEIFEGIAVDWFDESSDLGVDEGIEVDLSYFFGQGDYTIRVSEEMYGRVIAQYPTQEIVNRCAVMEYFKKDVIMDINDMWEQVKGETFPTWLIILIAVLVVLLGIAIVIIRNKEKFPWLKLPENDKTYYERIGCKVIKKEDII